MDDGARNAVQRPDHHPVRSAFGTRFATMATTNVDERSFVDHAEIVEHRPRAGCRWRLPIGA
jgi:hypothetical protein